MLCQPVHPESIKSLFHKFSVLDSALWFFIKTRSGVKKSNFKIICPVSVRFLAVSRPILIIGYLGKLLCCANQCTQNQVKMIFPAFFSLIVLFLWYYLDTYLRVRKNDFKIIFPPSFGSLSVSRLRF